jgi:hypothetical protein
METENMLKNQEAIFTTFHQFRNNHARQLVAKSISSCKVCPIQWFGKNVGSFQIELKLHRSVVSLSPDIRKTI